MDNLLYTENKNISGLNSDQILTMRWPGVWKKKEKKRSLEANERATSVEGFEAPEEKCARMLILC